MTRGFVIYDAVDVTVIETVTGTKPWRIGDWKRYGNGSLAVFDGTRWLRIDVTGAQFSLIDESTGLNAPLSVWDVRAATAAFRSQNTTGFREVYLRDSNFNMDSSKGRLAWLIVDKVEPQFLHWVEHFLSLSGTSPATLPPQWITHQTAGGSWTGTNDEGGVLAISTGALNGDWASIDGQQNNVNPSKELHQEWYITRIFSGLANTQLALGMSDTFQMPPQGPPANGFYWFYDSAVSANWKVRVRAASADVTGSPFDTGVAVSAGQTQLRLEFWPGAVGAAFATNTLKAYVNGVVVTNFPNGINLGGTMSPLAPNAPWTTLMRPACTIQSTSAAAKRLDLDAFKAFWLETWKTIQV